MKTVYLLEPLTSKARKWVVDNIHYESWQVYGHRIAIEHRLMGAILQGIEDAGLVRKTDYVVR